jgi:hypothetical protein
MHPEFKKNDNKTLILTDDVIKWDQLDGPKHFKGLTFSIIGPVI